MAARTGGQHANTQGTDAELNILTPYIKLNPGSLWDVPLRYNYIHMKISNYVRTGPSQIVAQQNNRPNKHTCCDLDAPTSMHFTATKKAKEND